MNANLFSKVYEFLLELLKHMRKNMRMIHLTLCNKSNLLFDEAADVR